LKLYILLTKNNEKVIAISEEKNYIYEYIIQNNLSQEYIVTSNKDKEFINKFLILYEDLILNKYEEYILTNIEQRMIDNIITEEVLIIKDTIDNLNHIYKDYNFDSKERKQIKKVINIIRKKNKPKYLFSLLKIKDFINDIILKKNKNILESLKEEISIRDSNYNIFNKEEIKWI
jgi:hypothetical protein